MKKVISGGFKKNEITRKYEAHIEYDDDSSEYEEFDYAGQAVAYLYEKTKSDLPGKKDS
jgi:hypothetical protein